MVGTPGKNIAMIAYAPFVGFFIAFFMNSELKHPFATWHIKNMFGLFLLFVVSMVVQTQVNVILGDIMWLMVFVLWIFSFVMAVRNQQKAIPLLSEKFQQWFTFLN